MENMTLGKQRKQMLKYSCSGNYQDQMLTELPHVLTGFGSKAGIELLQMGWNGES